MRVCHVSGVAPGRGGSPFLLVSQDEILFDKQYRSSPDFLGQPINPGDLVVSAKHYYGESYQQLLDGVKLDALESVICKMARNGDVDGLKERVTQGGDVDFLDDGPLRLAALHGHTQAVDYLLTVPSIKPLCDRALDAFSWACKGGSVNVVVALEAKCPVKHGITEDELLMVARQGNQRLFRHLIFSEEVRADTEYLLEMVRNKWAEEAICERIGLTSRQSGGLSKRGIKVSL